MQRAFQEFGSLVFIDSCFRIFKHTGFWLYNLLLDNWLHLFLHLLFHLDDPLLLHLHAHFPLERRTPLEAQVLPVDLNFPLQVNVIFPLGATKQLILLEVNFLPDKLEVKFVDEGPILLFNPLVGQVFKLLNEFELIRQFMLYFFLVAKFKVVRDVCVEVGLGEMAASGALQVEFLAFHLRVRKRAF